MIKNEKQYQITKNLLKEFQDSLLEISQSNATQMDPVYKKIQEDSIKSQIHTFEGEIAEYETLRNGSAPFISVNSIANFYEILIKARISKGWTQADLAKRLEMKEQQIQRYEFGNYSTASLARIIEIASALEIR
ncbi:MAG: helix-turn-helix transcriptional regulator, partial [Bacteroidota bacterium]|nr:helix-turn-helix transcriptional regulator [Bacteroidota bacterium]